MIGYMGSDDLFYPEVFNVIYKYKNLLNIDAIYFDSYTLLYKSKVIKLRKCPNIEFNKKNLLKFGTIVGLQNIFFDRKNEALDTKASQTPALPASPSFHAQTPS